MGSHYIYISSCIINKLKHDKVKYNKSRIGTSRKSLGLSASRPGGVIIKVLKVFRFLLTRPEGPTHRAPQQDILVVGNDQDDVARFGGCFRTPDAAGEQRQEGDGCEVSSSSAPRRSRSAHRTCHQGLRTTMGTHTHTYAHSHTRPATFS